MELKVNIFIYSPLIIQQTILDFIKIAEIKVFKQNKKYCYLRIKGVQKKEENLFKREFMNYLLEKQACII